MTWLLSLPGAVKRWAIIAGAALLAALGLYAKGRSDGKSNELRKADRAYRETREKMDAVDIGDDAGALRDSMRQRGKRPGGL